MLEEIVLTLEAKDGLVFTIKRTRDGEKTSETWKATRDGKSGEIYAAYVSQKTYLSFQKLYNKLKNVGNRGTQSYKEILEELINIGRGLEYSGEKGIIFMLTKKSDGYHVKPYEAVNKNYTSVREIPAGENPDFEEMVLGELGTLPAPKPKSSENVLDGGNENTDSTSSTKESLPNFAEVSQKQTTSVKNKII